MTRTLIRRSASACGAVALGALLFAAPATAIPDPGPTLELPSVHHPASQAERHDIEFAQVGLGALAGAGLATAGAMARSQSRRRHLRTA